MLQENMLFADRYQLIKLLGRGGFSEVWLAKDTWTHLKIAIKVYAPGRGMDINGLREFCGELANVYDLNHSNLLKPQHVDSWQNMPYLIMPYCSEGSCVKHIGKMTEVNIWKLIHDVAKGLAYLHEKDVVHQDIKPDNILIDNDGHYLITDFGISSRARHSLSKSVILGNISGGSTEYMGPERFSKQPAPTKASDIWSIGSMVYELLEGMPPFGELGGGMQKAGAEIPYMKKQISDALKYTIYKMLSKDTWDRPLASTLVKWAEDPQKIEIDYDLIKDDDSSSSPEPILGSNRNATQRFGNNASSEPTSGIDRNGTQRLGEEDLFVEVSPKTLTIPAEGGISSIYIKTNAKTVLPSYNKQDWFKLYDSNGTYFIEAKSNTTRENRECVIRFNAYSDIKVKTESLEIKQTSLPVAKKKWGCIWALIIFIVIFIFTAIYINDECEYISYWHGYYVNQFDENLRKLDSEDVESFKKPMSDLEDIKYYEDKLLFTGSNVYYTKKSTLKQKIQEAYNETDRKYNDLKSETNQKKRLRVRREEFNKLINKLW